jgi:hypothetical protein
VLSIAPVPAWTGDKEWLSLDDMLGLGLDFPETFAAGFAVLLGA